MTRRRTTPARPVEVVANCDHLVTLARRRNEPARPRALEITNCDVKSVRGAREAGSTTGDDEEPVEEKMKRLTAKLEEQFAESQRLTDVIRENLRTFANAT